MTDHQFAEISLYRKAESERLHVAKNNVAYNLKNKIKAPQNNKNNARSFMNLI